MNFKTRMSYNNRLLFIDKNGEVRQTRFIEVAYHGDNYVLAKGNDDIFYTVLDLEGHEVDPSLYVVHRFQNGLLLTYSAVEKDFTSSDKYKYYINYNIYKVLNYDTRRSAVINVIQSDSLLAATTSGVLQDKYRKLPVKDFLNKPIYCFRDLIFSEVMDNQFIITASYNKFTAKSSRDSFSFELYKDKAIWGVLDIINQKELNVETAISTKLYSNLTFTEAEVKLADVMAGPEKPFVEDYEEKVLYNDATAEFNMYNSWRRKNKWKAMLSKMLAFTIN